MILTFRLRFHPLLLCLFYLSFQSMVFSQEHTYGLNAVSSISYSDTEVQPFWLRSNKFGDISGAGFLSSLAIEATKKFRRDSGKVDWAGGFKVRANGGSNAEVILPVIYIKTRIGPFEFLGGRSAEQMGLGTDSLSSGSFAVSGNALSIPKIQLSLPDYYYLPFLKRVFSIKGSISHGWLGKTKIQLPGSAVDNARTYFHQKSFYGRFGAPNWKINVLGGFNQQVFWGNERKIFGDNYELSKLQTIIYVFSGKNYEGKNLSHLGNQIGTIDVGFQINLPKLKIGLYRQNFYDKGALYYLANIRDGLNGISISSTKGEDQLFHLKKIVFEFLYTKNQAGEEWSPWTPSGPEQYYNHGVYAEGYSYKGETVGSPFITPKKYARQGLPSSPLDYFINNRVVMLHTGFEVILAGWLTRMKISFSENYGTFYTSDVSAFWFNNRRIPRKPQYGVFQKREQLSFFFGSEKKLSNRMTLGFEFGLDRGGLLYNSNGFNLMVKKSF